MLASSLIRPATDFTDVPTAAPPSARAAEVGASTGPALWPGRARRRLTHSGVVKKSSYGAAPPRRPEAMEAPRELSLRFLAAAGFPSPEASGAGVGVGGVGDVIPHLEGLNGE
eukprot:scaffold33142_cov101-Isochrysis_galbana.AAC.2